jgi:hypothetical protein
MSTMEIRRPVASWTSGQSWPSVNVDRPIENLRFGIRTEGSWRSFKVLVGEWEAMLRDDGAEPEQVVAPIQRVGAARAHYADLVTSWADAVDCGISGLCTCGSCTSVAVADATILERAGKSTVLIATSEFERHARNMAAFLGHPAMKVLVLPHPLEGRPEDELRSIAAEYYQPMLDLVGVTR